MVRPAAIQVLFEPAPPEVHTEAKTLPAT
jgi:hypothetical protein